MLYIYDVDEGRRYASAFPTASLNPYKSAGGEHLIEGLLHFAKENALWEPPKVRRGGWEAIHIHEDHGIPLMYQHADDAQPGEINRFAGNIILDLLQENVKLRMKNEPVEVWSPERKKLLSRVYVETDKSDKDSCMYLRQALEYLDKYGGERGRVIAYPPTERDPYRMDLSFQHQNENMDWKEFMNGGLEFFPENAGSYKRSLSQVGWSVCT